MNTKHTPGPWKAIANRPDDDPKLDRIKAADGHNVAFIPAYELPYQEERANALIIAKTPDLLELLQQFVDATSGPRDQDLADCPKYESLTFDIPVSLILAARRLLSKQ